MDLPLDTKLQQDSNEISQGLVILTSLSEL